MALGGNPQTMSALTHLGCLTVHSTDRASYLKTGKPDLNAETGIIERVVVGSPRISFPIREDMRLQIMKIIRKTLQVDRRSETPLKTVRYPREEGELKANLLQERKNWLVSMLKKSKKDAHAFAMAELENFFQQEDIDAQDPLGSLTEVS